MRFVGGVADAEARSGNAMTRHERLGERLAALELSGGARRTEDPVAGGAEAIDDAAIERQLGSHDREVEAIALGERQQLVHVADVDGKNACISRDAGISWNTSH